MTAPLIRIALRWLAGMLVMKGILSAEEGASFAADPDVAMLVEVGAGLALGAAAEAWYWAAKRMGWRT